MTSIPKSVCILCGKTIDEKSIEHIIPESIMGTLKSGKILCRNCNNQVGSELDWVLKRRFHLILLGLNLCNIHKNKEIKADLSYKGEEYVFTKEGPRKKHPTIIRNGKKITWEFSSKKMARKHLKKYKRKNPDIDIDDMIDKAEREKFNFDEPFDFVADAPIEETWRVCGKIGSEFFFLIKPSYKPSNDKFKKFLLGNIPLEEFPICLFYSKYNPINIDRDCIYHIIIIEARKEDKLIIGYLDIFSCFKVIMLLDKEYEGESFKKGYFQNLMTMENNYFDPLEEIPVSRGELLDLMTSCKPEKYVYNYVEDFYKSSFKARIYPLKELLIEMIDEIKLKNDSSKVEKYQFVLDKFLNEFQRLGLDSSIVEEVSEDYIEDTLLEKIRKIIEYISAYFSKLEMNIDIIEELVKLI